MNPKKVVLDTNVIFSALFKKISIPNDIWQMVLNGELKLFYSEEILAEYEEVLSRPKFSIDEEEKNSVLAYVVNFGKKIYPEKSKIGFTDEDDRIFFDVAKQIGAILITGNKKHFPNDPDVLSPAEFMDKYYLE
jgi:putative PIN family toxin of toxin-antitoxin system